jgi:zinc/manganese transport system substrate-binding protein
MGHPRIRLPRPPGRAATLLLVPITALVVAGCGSGTTTGRSGALQIVAAENFWGSIAAQLAGPKARVQSIISNPATDPHSYEPTAADARALAGAQLAIVNGVGYDPWAPRLLAADSAPTRTELDVGAFLGLKDGDNPHRWYSPANVESVADAVTADLKRLDPRDAGYFDARLATFRTRGLATYHALISRISSRYAGVPVGASESIFALLSTALGLRLITPASFMKSVSEGTEVSAQDVAITGKQLADHTVKVWIYNSQNATPEIQQLNDLARREGIPIATITETLSPARASFQDWQSAQLTGIAQALHQATGR